MREYTTIITIKVIASVMAESEHDAEALSRGIHYSHDPADPPEYYGLLPDLVHPQVINLTAYCAVGKADDGFKARTFKEAYRELYPDIEPGCEAKRVVFPPRHPMLPEDS
jgi:hypothetical protein